MVTDQVSGRSMPESADGDGAMSQVQQQVQDKASDMKGKAVHATREQIDTRTTDLGDQVHSVADALRRSAEQLDEDGKSGPAGIARRAAGQADRLSAYLKNSSSDRFLDDVEAFARKRPWAAGGIGAVVGLAASRFLKASSGGRYAQSAHRHPDLDAPLSRDDAPYVPAARPTMTPPVEGRRP